MAIDDLFSAVNLEDAPRGWQARVILATHRQDLTQTGDIPRPPQKARLATIQRIAPEILRMMFTFAKPSDLADCFPSRKSPPLTLIQVCSLWRRIALATPDLWTGLYISLYNRIIPRDPANVRRYEELATQWFSRAGPHLGLSLQFDDSVYINHHDFSNIILSRPERFKELRIRLQETRSLATFIRGHGNASFAFSLLEDLTINCYQSGVGVSFAAAGCLRRMNVRIPFDSWLKMENFAPWEQLTCLETGSLQGSVWVPLLAQCINLENGTFEINHSFDELLPAVNVSMARLTSLSITFAGEPSSIDVFDGFRFPALTLLHLELGWDFSWHNAEHFYDQLRSLRTFTFVGQPKDLLRLLPHTPSLIHLHATIHPDLDALLIGLTATNVFNTLVPDLKQLAIQPNWEWFHWSSPPSVGSLLTMVASRTEHNHALPCSLEYLAIVIPDVELGGLDSSDLERRLHALQMSRSDNHGMIPYRMMNMEMMVTHVWRRAN